MPTASEEFLVRLRYWLVSGGRITRSACGTTIEPQRSAARRPSEEAASGLPLVHGQNAGAHDLGDEGRGIGRQRRSPARRIPGSRAMPPAKLKRPAARALRTSTGAPTIRATTRQADHQASEGQI